MTLEFAKYPKGSLIETIHHVLGLHVIAHPNETEVRIWFEPSKIVTVYWLKPDEFVLSYDEPKVYA